MVGIILIIITGIGCRTDKNENLTVIQGNIEVPLHDKIYFYSYPDSESMFLANMEAMDSSTLDKDGNFILTPVCKKPFIFNLVHGNQDLATNLFLLSGNKITINFRDKNNQPEVFPSGEEAKFTAYLINFLDTFYKEPATKQEYYIATNYMDIHQFRSYCEKREQKQFDFFNDYFKNDSLNLEFKFFAHNTIQYGIAVDKLMYVWKKRMKGEIVAADSSYFSFETPSFIENKDAFSCPSYIRFLNLYIKDTYERMVERGEFQFEKSKTVVPQVEKFKLAFQLLHKPYRDVVIYTIILGDMNDLDKINHVPRSYNTSLDSMIAWFESKYSLNSFQ